MVSALAELIESVRNLPPTEYERLQIRIMDALLQFEIAYQRAWCARH